MGIHFGSGIHCVVRLSPPMADGPEHSGIGEHEGGVHPLELVGMTAPAGQFPETGIGRIFPGDHFPVGGFFVFFKGVSTVTGDTVRMGIGGRFERLVALPASIPVAFF